jgi:hypothetical protein
MPHLVSQKIHNLSMDNKISGPHPSQPFDNFIVSPLGLVPKQTPGEWRLIHHLSHPRGESVNDGIPMDFSKVQYQDFDHALKLVAQAGKGSFIAKSDIQSAFHVLPIHKDDHPLLGFMWDNKYYYFKVAPMGCSRRAVPCVNVGTNERAL